MASIIREIVIEADPVEAWDALRDFGAIHERLARGFVVGTTMDAKNSRTVRFVTGAVAKEDLIGCDDELRRIAYSVVDGPLQFTHHNSSAQVFAFGDRQTRLVWSTDVLPDDIAPRVQELMEHGLNAMKTTLEGGGTER